MSRSMPAPVTAQLSSYAANTQQAVSGLYALASQLSQDLHGMPARQRAAATQRGLPVPATFDHDAADVRAAIEHAHVLQALLPAALKLSEAVTAHLERLDDYHRRMIHGPTRDELPPDVWS